MKSKVRLAIFDKDLKARTYKKFPVSDDGDQIQVKSGGSGHWMPEFDNNSFIELPYRSIFSPWRRSWRRIYFVRKGAKACVDFKTPTTPGPDPDLVKDAAGKVIVDRLGKSKQEAAWWQWALLALNFIILLKVLGMI